jgi:2-iminobutanoate/2-iminopropanoate deaminase
MSLRRTSPDTVAPPISGAKYSHSVAVPANARWLYTAGQLGVRPDGVLPESFEEQIDWCWRNIAAVLAADDMSIEDLVKVTTFLIDPQHWPTMVEVRGRHLGDIHPAQTLLYVAGLVTPLHLCEVEVVAAKA